MNKIDAFICHASEDKRYFVEPLAKQLIINGSTVWFDKYSLNVGDSLMDSIQKGLSESRFGIVVFSESFFKKKWPQSELKAIFSLQQSGKIRIIPVYYKIEPSFVIEKLNLLSDPLGVRSSIGISGVAEAIIKVCRPELSQEFRKVQRSPMLADPIVYGPTNPYSVPTLLEKSSLRDALINSYGDIDWERYLDGLCGLFRDFNIRQIDQLYEVLSDESSRVVLNSIYERLLGREVDNLGLVQYLPHIYFRRASGVQYVEASIKSKQEYSSRHTIS